MMFQSAQRRIKHLIISSFGLVVPTVPSTHGISPQLCFSKFSLKDTEGPASFLKSSMMVPDNQVLFCLLSSCTAHCSSHSSSIA